MRAPNKLKTIIRNQMKSKIIALLLIKFNTNNKDTQKMCKKLIERNLIC